MANAYNARELLKSQIAYYRASAAEMDAGIRLVLSADTTEYADQFRRGTETAVGFLRDAVSGRDTLEIAAGTGVYTERLVLAASRLTALDASPESIEINRALMRRNGHDVEFIVEDIFAWEPPRKYEAIVFTFWLSHIPVDLFDAFWSQVDAAAAPGAVVGFADAPGPDLAPRDLESLEGAPDIVVEDRPEEGVTIRKVRSGQVFPIVRIAWPQAVLRERLARLGWSVEFATGVDMLIGRAIRP